MMVERMCAAAALRQRTEELRRKSDTQAEQVDHVANRVTSLELTILDTRSRIRLLEEEATRARKRKLTRRLRRAWAALRGEL